MKYILSNQEKDSGTEIIIGRDALEGLNGRVSRYTKIAVITDEGSAASCLPALRQVLRQELKTVILPEGEDSKSLKLAEDTLRRLQEEGFDRKSLIIGLGGGVINDIAGFVASMYMRGIDWIMLPTTLTAQADAAIGGKTGVNLAGYKNMVGSFWPARAVLIDPGFLDSLPKKHLRNGLAEIIKVGFISDANILSHVRKMNPDKLLGAELESASELAAKAKIDIVSKDTYEAGERKLLNFGHTVGHALEAISLTSGKPLLHGEAISVGMVAEARLAELEKVCSQGLADEVAKTLERFGLPISYQAGTEAIMEHILSDKKNVEGNIHWTLPVKAGEGIYDHIAGDSHVRTAIESVAG
ncbi:MAG TPA: 3-dehydroquinate synthase [Candidatus Saccharimonadales bacterium]|nr:3-dehydroquinate synthase [Candidatus Saccharimonadales bacterium]